MVALRAYVYEILGLFVQFYRLRGYCVNDFHHLERPTHRSVGLEVRPLGLSSHQHLSNPPRVP